MVKTRENNRGLSSKKPGAKQRKLKIKDLAKFRLFVEKNKEKTQTQMAQLWGENLTQQNISDACQKLGIIALHFQVGTLA